MAVNLSPVGGAAAQFFDNSGNVLTGGKLYTYLAGTTTPAITYTTSAGNTAHSNPIVLDAAGRVPDSGEIWLTDAILYKFVLKDQNDVQISVWDNIAGINSNFVNYVTQQEIQTATAGQTVFNLADITYQPGTNNLSVFVDGVNQYGPGAPYAYDETDADTVTFLTGLYAGALVKFTSAIVQSVDVASASQISFIGFEGQIGTVQDLADDDGSNWVGFLQDGTNAVAESVQTKLRQIISPQDFGAVGDGVQNDVTAVTNAFNSGDNKVIDGGNQIYKCNSVITCTSENVTIQNMTLDFSSVPDTGTSPELILTFAGTQGTATTLTSNAVAGVSTISVASTTGFIANSYAWIYSTELFDAATSTTLGNIVKIKSIDSSTQLTIYDTLEYDYTTTYTASIAPLVLKENITFKNVKFIGSGLNDQALLNFDKCINVIVDGCNFEFGNYMSVRLNRVVNGTVTKSSVKYARLAGTAYGIGILNGCYGIKVDSSYGEDTRHFVTCVGGDGVSMYINITNNIIDASRDAGIDSHPCSNYVLISNNTVRLAATIEGISDGIIYQGLNCIISNNLVSGASAHGIIVQRYPQIGGASCVVTGNSIQNGYGTVASDFGIYVLTQSGAGAANPTTNVNISNNSMEGSFDVVVGVYAYQGSISNLSITGNNSYQDAAVIGFYLQAAAGYEINQATVSANIIKTASTECLYISGTDADSIQNINVSGNTLVGTSRGIRLINVSNGNLNTNTMYGITTPYFSSGSKNIVISDSLETPYTITTATYTVEIGNQYLIADRAGTVTITLPTAANWVGRTINIKTVQAQTVVSASSDVVPITGGAAATAILPATDGSWALLKSDGTNWVVMQKG